jgi:hypothetical protein
MPGPLRDHMEIIGLAGYTANEKFEIARRYLVPRQMEANGVQPGQVEIADEALRDIIQHYTPDGHHITGSCLRDRTVAGSKSGQSDSDGAKPNSRGAPRAAKPIDRRQGRIHFHDVVVAHISKEEQRRRLLTRLDEPAGR